MGNLNLGAIARGAAVTTVFAVPAGIVQNLIDRESSLSFALFLVVVLALGVGGWVAGQRGPRPRPHPRGPGGAHRVRRGAGLRHRVAPGPR